MKITTICVLMAVLGLSSCSRSPLPCRTIHVTTHGLTLDSHPLNGQSLQELLHADVFRYGHSMPITIVAEPSALVSGVITEVARTGFWKLSFSIEGKTNAVEFSPRPDDICGPPVYVVSALVTPAGTTVTTNFSMIESAGTNWGAMVFFTRVFFCMTPDATAEALYIQMRGWQEKDAAMYWDEAIIPNEQNQPITGKPGSG